MKVGSRVAILSHEDGKNVRLEGSVTAVELAFILVELDGRLDRWGYPERRWYAAALVQPRSTIVVLEGA